MRILDNPIVYVTNDCFELLHYIYSSSYTSDKDARKVLDKIVSELNSTKLRVQLYKRNLSSCQRIIKRLKDPTLRTLFNSAEDNVVKIAKKHFDNAMKLIKSNPYSLDIYCNFVMSNSKEGAYSMEYFPSKKNKTIDVINDFVVTPFDTLYDDFINAEMENEDIVFEDDGFYESRDYTILNNAINDKHGFSNSAEAIADRMSERRLRRFNEDLVDLYALRSYVTESFFSNTNKLLNKIDQMIQKRSYQIAKYESKLEKKGYVLNDHYEDLDDVFVVKDKKS